MKKLLFSAVALVAFSGVSFGNTIEINEQLNQNKAALINTDSDTPCTDTWVIDMKIYQKWGYTFEEALEFADADWDICMDEVYGD